MPALNEHISDYGVNSNRKHAPRQESLLFRKYTLDALYF